MTGGDIALDTSAAIIYMHGDPSGKRLETYGDFHLPTPALGELQFGALRSVQPATRTKTSEFVSRCTILNITASTCEHYARIRLDLTQRGKPIPVNDVWIAACCLEHNLPLATTDPHFGQIPQLQLVLR